MLISGYWFQKRAKIVTWKNGHRSSRESSKTLNLLNGKNKEYFLLKTSHLAHMFARDGPKQSKRNEWGSQEGGMVCLLACKNLKKKRMGITRGWYTCMAGLLAWGI